MNGKVYVLAGVLAVIIALAAGIYWHFQKTETGVYSESQELSYETENLSQDVQELEEVSQDTNLDTLDQDLSNLAGEQTSGGQTSGTASGTPAVDTSSIESLESELSAELDGLGNDLTDLEGFAGDNSLDNLDDSLSGLTQ